MTFIDTASSNTSALSYFKRMGYGRPEAEVWMSKLIQRPRKLKTIATGSHRNSRRLRGDLPKKIANLLSRLKRDLDVFKPAERSIVVPKIRTVV